MYIFFSGSVERRWITCQPNGPCEVNMSLRAISVKHEQKRLAIDMKQMTERMVLAEMEWRDEMDKIGESGIRDQILRSICPEINGMYPVKLAIALAVSSGGIDSTTSMSGGLNKRGQSHLLLVGDPGLAKSKLLLSAASFAPRAIQTTGMGCSTAGLTAAAVKENGEWQLEAGALVLADGGICCIDEFNLMRENDKASIHEAMEQQTISMAKAGLVCKLTTRCAILAAANPKNLYTMSDPEGTCSLNIGIASPLLSRFDLVFVLRDERNPEWDGEICDHLLRKVIINEQCESIFDKNLWSNERLRNHFVASRNIHPKISDNAKLILGAYYKACRSDPQRDPGRTTVRLLDSLNRLAQAYARLLFRHTVNASDAALIIRLMESTHGFGRILPPFDIIKETLPLGPDKGDVNDVFRILKLGEYVREAEDGLSNEPNLNRNSTQTSVASPEILSIPEPMDTTNQTDTNSDLDEILHFDFSQNLNKNSQNLQKSPEKIIKTSSPSKESDDEIDLILSQVLDHVESSQKSTEEMETVRPTVSLQKFSFGEKSKMVLKRSQKISFNEKLSKAFRNQCESGFLSSSEITILNGSTLNESSNLVTPPGPESNEKKSTETPSTSKQSVKRGFSLSAMAKLNSFKNSYQ